MVCKIYEKVNTRVGKKAGIKIEDDRIRKRYCQNSISSIINKNDHIVIIKYTPYCFPRQKSTRNPHWTQVLKFVLLFLT